ncbi:hypothetical protein V3C99_003959 [Haemonchus contortus]|uniref:Transmembrane protein n=1 Tax=Haemonchus contortus TaxID=6289 RepID=A0A7I4XZP5_HAECO|nr:Protein F52A8.1 [Haemonchus contortus]
MAWAVVKISSCLVASLAEEIATEFVTKDESLDPLRQTSWCPTFQVGTQCPENSFIFYYKCCGHLHKECCSHLRVWVLVLIIALPLLFIVPPVVYLMRRIFCKADHRPYSAGIQMTTREPRESRRDTR